MESEVEQGVDKHMVQNKCKSIMRQHIKNKIGGEKGDIDALLRLVIYTSSSSSFVGMRQQSLR